VLGEDPLVARARAEGVDEHVDPGRRDRLGRERDDVRAALSEGLHERQAQRRKCALYIK
jgi:hypothetical protein